MQNDYGYYTPQFYPRRVLPEPYPAYAPPRFPSPYGVFPIQHVAAVPVAARLPQQVRRRPTSVVFDDAVYAREDRSHSNGNSASIWTGRPYHPHSNLTPYSSLTPYSYRSDYTGIATTSTATRSNNVGAGRNLGNVYSFFGRRLEALMSVCAERFGFGPRATKQKVEDIVMAVELNAAGPATWRRRKWIVEQELRIRRHCTRLLKYTHSPVSATQLQALDALYLLVLRSPIVSESLRRVDAIHHLEILSKLLSSRRERYSRGEMMQLKSRREKLLKVLRG
ncbi:hypothetical protein DFH11DRAFT_1549821 [Phellopilus nigrolimitatus]|nr:hypothetical protein DFH11DRAFT_1549821 [Phellopilus nigrolimitatus]